MEALIPKLFIITAEASIVLFLLLVVMIIFNIKAKRRDISTVNELIKDYVENKIERINSIKKQLKKLGFTGDSDDQAQLLFDQEKSLIKEFVTLYLRRDSYRLMDYPENVMDSHNNFLKINGSQGGASSAGLLPDAEAASNESANATIMAREQAESNQAHLKELAELRLKNTELNEHLYEALETITALHKEHGKVTGQDVESNAQKILEAILYLRDQRLGNESGSNKSSSPESNNAQDPWSVDLANDDTLDDSTAVNIGINDELNTDLDTVHDLKETPPINLEESDEEGDPWADALAEQAESSGASEDENDPWADALAEQATAEASADEDEDEDPWADALAEQATAEASADEDEDPWADALAEQATAEASADEDEDPWADALAEQAASESESNDDEDEDPWAAALAEQDKAEKS